MSFVKGNLVLKTDRQTDRPTDRPTDRLTDRPKYRSDLPSLKKQPQNKSTSKVRIERNKENESCSTT